jgi:hypothetical protein
MGMYKWPLMSTYRLGDERGQDLRDRDLDDGTPGHHILHHVHQLLHASTLLKRWHRVREELRVKAGRDDEHFGPLQAGSVTAAPWWRREEGERPLLINACI